MTWIKRNLFFVIGSVVALVLVGLAGWYLYSKWGLNNEILTSLNADNETLKSLNNQNPHPGNNKIDNIQAAKDQRKQLLDFSLKSRPYFQPIPRIPDEAKITDHEFSGALDRTIDQLQREATNASVALPPNYRFTFEAQKSKVSFAAGSLERLSVKLGEVKVISEILFQAKVNSLDSIRRERVSTDDSVGPQTDYVSDKTVTNELAVLTPYELNFRCFSAELALVLSSLAASPYGFVVKTINVESAPPAAAGDQLVTTPYTYVPQQTAAQYPTPAASEAASRAAMMRRYGINRGGPGGGGAGGIPLRDAPMQQPAQPVYAPPTPQPGAGPAGKGGLTTVLDEKLLKVTINLVVVKLLPPKKAD
jgi:hypothetical protein